MKKTFMLMRHAQAVSDNPAWSDKERPLTPRGRHVAERTARLLTEFRVGEILSSSAVRCRQTAEIIAENCGSDPGITLLDWLYLAPPDSYIEALRTLSPETQCGMILGHNPGLASLIRRWTDESFSVDPGCVAIFTAEVDDWALLENQHHVRPELVGVISDGVRVR